MHPGRLRALTLDVQGTRFEERDALCLQNEWFRELSHFKGPDPRRAWFPVDLASGKRAPPQHGPTLIRRGLFRFPWDGRDIPDAVRGCRAKHPSHRYELARGVERQVRQFQNILHWEEAPQD